MSNVLLALQGTLFHSAEENTMVYLWLMIDVFGIQVDGSWVLCFVLSKVHTKRIESNFFKYCKTAQAYDSRWISSRLADKNEKLKPWGLEPARLNSYVTDTRNCCWLKQYYDSNLSSRHHTVNSGRQRWISVFWTPETAYKDQLTFCDSGEIAIKSKQWWSPR